MDRETYKLKRQQLILEAQNYIVNGDVTKSNEVQSKISELDNQYTKESEAQANLNALNYGSNLNPIPNHFTCDNGVNLSGPEVESGTLFLNKGESLRNRIGINESNSVFNKTDAIGELVRGVVTGKWSDDNFKNAITTSATGVLIPELLSSEIIDKARDISLFTLAGVPIAPMDNGNMVISRLKTDPTFSFKQEGKEGTEGNFELDSIKLSAKTCYGYAYVSMEAIQSSSNLGALIIDVFAKSMANTIDLAFMYGQKNSENTLSEFAPRGIMNDESINTIAATQGSGYDSFIKAIGKVRKANGTPSAYGINSETEEILSLLKSSDGQYLDKPKAMDQLTECISNQLRHDEVEGSDAIVFDPKALIIGVQKYIHIKIIEDTECLKKGLVGFQIYAMLDCQTIKPSNICKISGIK